MKARLAISLLALSFATLGACSLLVQPDTDELGQRPPFCEPAGCYSVCACAGGSMGRQLCNDRGAYDACDCTDNASSLGTQSCESARVDVAAGAGTGGQ